MGDATWIGCDHVALDTRLEGTAVLETVHEAILQLRLGAAARERLAWRATNGLRRSLMTPPESMPDTDTDTDTDTDSGTTGLSTDGESDSESSGGTTTGGQDPGPMVDPQDGWAFDSGAYTFAEGDLWMQSRWSATEELPFASPGELLVFDLLSPDSYLRDFVFVPTQEDPPLLPSAGELTFSEVGPYYPLLGIDGPQLESPHPVVRDMFVDPSASEGLTNWPKVADEVMLLVDRVVDEGDLVALSATAEPVSLFELFVGAAQIWSASELDRDARLRRHVRMSASTGNLPGGRWLVSSPPRLS